MLSATVAGQPASVAVGGAVGVPVIVGDGALVVRLGDGVAACWLQLAVHTAAIMNTPTMRTDATAVTGRFALALSSQ